MNRSVVANCALVVAASLFASCSSHPAARPEVELRGVPVGFTVAELGSHRFVVWYPSTDGTGDAPTEFPLAWEPSLLGPELSNFVGTASGDARLDAEMDVTRTTGSALVLPNLGTFPTMLHELTEALALHGVVSFVPQLDVTLSEAVARNGNPAAELVVELKALEDLFEREELPIPKQLGVASIPGNRFVVAVGLMGSVAARGNLPVLRLLNGPNPTDPDQTAPSFSVLDRSDLFLPSSLSSEWARSRQPKSAVVVTDLSVADLIGTCPYSSQDLVARAVAVYSTSIEPFFSNCSDRTRRLDAIDEIAQTTLSFFDREASCPEPDLLEVLVLPCGDRG